MGSCTSSSSVSPSSKRDILVKKRLIGDLKKEFPKARSLNGDSYFEILIQIDNMFNTIKISLPDDFPQYPPVIKVQGPVTHPWLNENMIVVGNDKLNAWTLSSSLVEVVNYTVTALENHESYVAIPKAPSRTPQAPVMSSLCASQTWDITNSQAPFRMAITSTTPAPGGSNVKPITNSHMDAPPSYEEAVASNNPAVNVSSGLNHAPVCRPVNAVSDNDEATCDVWPLCPT